MEMFMTNYRIEELVLERKLETDTILKNNKKQVRHSKWRDR